MHLYTPRVGWEGERLAHYLLSRFSFVAQPTSIADDVGSDFYCTIFELLESTPPMVEPRTSFAIQVKSNGQKVEAHNKIQYLRHLEIPFFLGVVDQAKAELRIYSADFFPMMTAVFGFPEKLWLRPVDDASLPPWEGDDATSGVLLNCYYVCTFNASEGRKDLRSKVEQLLKICQRGLANIATRRAEEHIYKTGDDAKAFAIVAGCGSVNFFRDNIYMRLAAAFYNFNYMLTHDPQLFSMAEFQVYESFHLALRSGHWRESLALADERYRAVKRLVDHTHSSA